MSLLPEHFDRLKHYADKRHTSVAGIVRNLLLAIPYDDDTVTPYVLKIPRHIDQYSLPAWLEKACAEIQHLYSYSESLEDISLTDDSGEDFEIAE